MACSFYNSSVVVSGAQKTTKIRSTDDPLYCKNGSPIFLLTSPADCFCPIYFQNRGADFRYLGITVYFSIYLHFGKPFAKGLG